MPKSHKGTKARRRSSLRDPHRDREARKYEFPIPSRELILTALTEQGVPLDFDEVSKLLALDSERDRESLARRLNAMCRDGQLLRNRRGGYCVVDQHELVPGRVIGHPDGFGFLHPDAGGDDLFLAPRQMRRLWHGDKAVARVTSIDRRGRREGEVVEITDRNTERVVGRLRIDAGVGILTPDNKRMQHDVLIPTDELAGARDGQIVVARITSQPDTYRQPVGQIVEVVGDHLAAGMQTDIAIRSHDIPAEWPEAVEQEIVGLSPEVPRSAKRGRQDLRDLPLVTIDGADARDFDDAVYCRRTPKGWRLYVCIADVSHYVRPATALDNEAYHRGTSVYFPDRVVPMLPEILSNGLCSLNPGVDRLCMTAELLISEDGEIGQTRFYSAVMHSQARLTYDEVGAILLDGDRKLTEQYSSVVPHLQELHELYRVLHRARAQRGAIDFDTIETRFQFNDRGQVVGITPMHRHDAHRLIEECMLAANVATARRLLKARIPALYRIHERPNEDKLSDLRDFLATLGLKLGGGLEPSAMDYARLLDKVNDRADAHLIQTVLLRSMMQAVYSAENVGHFGLSFDAYAHFTSPIRRYPDLMVHRALKHLERGGKPASFEYRQSDAVTIAEHCSSTERRADEATRDAEDALKCEYMEQHLGDTFPGRITGVTGFGLFVELEEVYVTGLVHITALDHDFFHFDPIGHKLTGERSGKTYRLSDPLQVRVAAVNLDDRKIDLVLAERGGRKTPRRGRRR